MQVLEFFHIDRRDVRSGRDDVVDAVTFLLRTGIIGYDASFRNHGVLNGTNTGS